MCDGRIEIIFDENQWNRLIPDDLNDFQNVSAGRGNPRLGLENGGIFDVKTVQKIRERLVIRDDFFDP